MNLGSFEEAIEIIKLTGGYTYHDDNEKFVCDDREQLENARIVRSLSDEEFEQLMREIKELEQEKLNC